MSADILEALHRMKVELLNKTGEDDFGLGDGEELTHAPSRALREGEEVLRHVCFVVQKSLWKPLLRIT